MDRQTVEFYNAHSAEAAQRYAAAPSRIAPFFPVAFPLGTRFWIWAVALDEIEGILNRDKKDATYRPR